MSLSEVIRFAAYGAASITYGLAVANLVISFKVLKPRPFNWSTFSGSGGGFIWMHIVCVVIPFQGFVAWGSIEVHQRFGDSAGWRVWALLSFSLIISVGYWIIFRVEMSRLRLAQALKGES